MTDETELNITEPQQPRHRTLLDEALGGIDRLETVVESQNEEDEEKNEPVYAQVIKHPKLTEYGQTNSPPELSTFKSPPNERRLYESPAKDRKPLRSPPLARHGNRNGSQSEEDGESGNDNLGFAFSFLNSQENSPQLSQKNFAADSQPKVSAKIQSPQIQSGNRIYRDLTAPQNQQEGRTEMGEDEASGENSSFHTYQPKFYGGMAAGQRNTSYNTRSFDDKIKTNKNNEKDQLGIKVIGGNEYNSRFDKQNSPISPEKPQFDLSKSIDKHYSNFSVNDIVRQNFLPTTRVHGDTTEKENEIKTILQNRNNPNREEATRKTSLTRLSSLNIQNQYQYQKSSQPISSTTLNDEEENRKNSIQQYQSLSIGSESYGKPIISPRPLYETPSPLPLPPQSLLDSTNESIEPRQTKYKPIVSKKNNSKIDEEKRKKSNKNETNMFSMERLKKTQHGTALLDREKNREEEFDKKEEIDPLEYSASKLFGTMSLSIEKLNENNNDQKDSSRDVGGVLLSKEKFERPTRINRSPPIESISIDRKPQNEHDTHELNGESSVSMLSQKINKTLGDVSDGNQQQPSPASEKKTMQRWIQQTDFRPKVTNPKFKNCQSPREKAASNQLKSRIDVFSKESDLRTPYEKFMKVSKENIKLYYRGNILLSREKYKIFCSLTRITTKK